MTLRPTKRRFAIGFYLLTGWTPWGVQLSDTPCLPRRDDGSWPMSCGHVLSTAEVLEWTADGLLQAGDASLYGPIYGQEVAVAGPELTRWVGDAFHNLKAQRWVRRRAA